MTSNSSSKFFRKILKTGLVSASTAALMLSGSGALGAATTIDANATFSTGVGLTPAAKFAGGTLQYTDDDFTVDADEAVNITAIDVNGKAPDLFMVNKNISLGSVNLNGGTAFPVSISDTFTLTLTGEDGLAQGPDIYTGLGLITLNGANAVLTINSDTPALITLAGNIDGGGIITTDTDTTINGTIGNVNPLAEISVGVSTLSLGGAVVKANTINLANAASQLTLTNANAVLTGAVDNITGGDGAGKINFNGAAAQITGNIGDTNSLATISVGAGTATLGGAVINATTTKLANAASVLTLTNANAVLTGDIDNTTGVDNKGTLNLNGALSQITGNIGDTNSLATISVGAGTATLGGAVINATTTKLANAASVLTLTNANAVLTGDIDNTTGADNKGTLNLNGALSQITGNIGNTNSLATISVGAGTATLGGAVINATTTKLANAASVLTLTNANAVLTGDIDNTTGADNKGTLNLNGALSQITGNIGNTNSLATISVGAGTATLGGAVINATTTKLANAASVLTLTNANAVLTGDIDNTTGADNKGTLNLNGALSQITGNIGNTNSLATISVGAGTATLGGAVINATTTKLANAASVLTLTNANAVLTGDIDNTTGVDNKGTLNLNGALSQITGNIGDTNSLATISVGAGTATLGGEAINATTTKLANAASVLTLTNANAVLTGDIDNTTGADNKGTLNLNGALSQITGNIGNTNSLATISVGADTATLGGAVINATTTKLANAASVLTLTNANAVLTGDIDNTTGADNKGTLNLNGALSQITGNIGNTNSLATISVGAGTATLGGAVINATTTKLANAASVLTLTNANAVLTGDIDNTTGADNKGTLNLNGALSQITGNIGDTNSLATISVGAGTATLGGAVINATTTKLANAASVLTLTNANAVLTGDIDNTTGADNKGTLNLNGALSQITGNIGDTNSLATISVGAGTATLGGEAINATTTKLANAASVLTLTNANAVLTGDIDNTTGADNKGTLNLNGALSQITGNIGNTNSLATISVGAGTATLGGAVIKANTINLTDNAAILSLTNAATVVTGDINFTGFTGTANLANGVTIDGDIINFDQANNKGIINFTGNGIVTGFTAGNPNKAGDAFSKINTINIKGAVGTTVELQKTVYVENLAFANGAGAGKLQVGGDLIANNIGFGAGGTLEFNDVTANAKHLFKGIIANGVNAILNVNTANLIAYDPSIGKVAEINIGADNFFEIDASAGDVTILDDQAINFGDADSNLVLSNLTGAAAKNILLAADLAAFGGGGGILFFDGGANGLNIDSNTANALKNIGAAAGNKFATLNIFNTVTVTKDINLAGIQALVINNGADFTDNGNTSLNIANITINDGTYRVDANEGDVAVPAANIKFANAFAALVLQNSSANDRTITLGANIDPNNENEGVVTLNSVNAGKKLTIAGGVTLGGAHKLKGIVFQGAGDFGTKGITFNTTNIGLNTTGVLELGATTANVTLLNDAVQLTQTGNIGGFLDFKGKNGTVTLNDKVNITGAVQNTDGNNNGTLIALGASNLNSVNGIAMLKVGAGAVSIGKGGDVKIGEIRGNGTALLTLPANFNLTGTINSGGGDALKLSFSGNSSVSGVVGTAANSVGDITTAGVTSFASSVNAKGTATLGGTTSFVDTFNNQGAVTLVPSSINNFAKDVTATSFKADGATMNFGNSLAFNSGLTGSGTTISLGSGQVAHTGQASFTGQLTLNTKFDGATNTGGNILITGAGSEMDLSGVTKLKVVISTTNFDPNNINPNTQYTLAAAASEGTLKQLASADAIETDIGTQENQFLKWTLNSTSLVLSPSIVDNVNDRIEEELTTGDLKDASLGVKADIRALETATDPNSEGFKFKVTMGNILDNEELTTKVMKAVGDSQDQVPSSDAVNNTTVAVTNTILNSAVGSSLNSRMNSFQAVNQPIAVASGDEDEAKFGVWATPFVGNSTQKMRNNINGNKTNFGGATVGFDGMINDQVVLGVAYTRAGTKIKQKNDKIGDSSKVKSNIYSIYGLYNLPNNNLFFQAVGSYSDSRIKSYSQRYQPVARNTLATQIANGNYKSRGFTGQIMAGYDYVAPQAVKLTPMVGLRYSKVKDSGYTETGTTLQNLIVKGKNYNLVNGLAGVKLSKDINTGHMILTPEIYGMLDYGFKNKLPTPDARLQGMTTPFPASKFKPVKTTWNLGAGVTAKYKMMEYGINYDANIASKYFAQQGSVKIRVNF